MRSYLRLRDMSRATKRASWHRENRICIVQVAFYRARQYTILSRRWYNIEVMIRLIHELRKLDMSRSECVRAHVLLKGTERPTKSYNVNCIDV